MLKMRWFLTHCIILTCIAALLATEVTNKSARPKRDIELLKKLFKTILIGSHHVLDKISPLPEPSQKYHKGNTEDYQIPGRHNVVVTEECDKKQNKLNHSPSLAVLESYLGTNTQKETLNAVQGIKNLFESGILTRFKQQGNKELTQDGLSLRPIDLYRPINSYPFRPFFIYPSEEESLNLSHNLFFGGLNPEKLENPAKIPGELPIHIGGVKENVTLEASEEPNNTPEQITENLNVSLSVLQNSNVVIDLPIPKPPPTFDGFEHISDFSVDINKEIPLAVLPLSPGIAPQPVVFDHKPIEVIPDAPIVHIPLSEVNHLLQPSHIHPIIESEVDFQQRPPFYIRPAVKSKYSYHQINQDSSLTSTFTHGNKPDVVVTNQPRPLPFYIFNRFQSICSKFGINLAHTRPVSKDVHVIIPDPIIVNPHNSRPIFHTPSKPTFQVPLNHWVHHYQNINPFLYHNLHHDGLISNFGSDAVNVKVTNRKQESLHHVPFHNLPVSPTHPSTTPEFEMFSMKPQEVHHASSFMYQQLHGDGTASIFEPNGVVVKVADTKKPVALHPMPVHGLPAPIQMSENEVYRTRPLIPFFGHNHVHSKIPISYFRPDNSYKNEVESPFGVFYSGIKSKPKPPSSTIIERTDKICDPTHSTATSKNDNKGYSFKIINEEPNAIYTGYQNENKDLPSQGRDLKVSSLLAGTLTRSDNYTFIADRIQQVPGPVHLNQLPKASSGYSLKLANGKGNISYGSSINNNIVVKNPDNNGDGSKETSIEDEDVILDVRKELADRKNISTAIKTSGAQVSVVIGKKGKIETTTLPKIPLFTAERIHQVATTARSTGTPKPLNGYSFSLANGKTVISPENTANNFNEPFLEDEDDSKLPSAFQILKAYEIEQENAQKDSSVYYNNLVNDYENNSTVSDTEPEFKLDSVKPYNRMALANHGDFTLGSKEGLLSEYNFLGNIAHSNPSENSGKIIINNLFVPPTEAEEETPFPTKTSVFRYLDNISSIFVPPAGIENNVPAPASKIMSDNIDDSTPFVNVKQVIVNEPVTSSYIYKQISHSNPINFTVVNIEEPLDSFNINTNAHSNPSPVSIKVDPNPKFSYKKVSNESVHVKPLSAAADKNSWQNNPIIIPEEEVTFSFKQNSVDGSNLTVLSNRKNEVTVNVNRGDIPDY